jgi:catechol 2,3-dioxygenase-like lactoylglutathione lyase family enzyme
MTVEWDWERVVFDHVKIGVRDAAASVDFYRAVLATLEIPPLWEREDGAQFANLVVREGDPGGPIHIAFVAASREQYSSPEAGRYYAAFLLDPDGNNVEAVRREEF